MKGDQSVDFVDEEIRAHVGGSEELECEEPMFVALEAQQKGGVTSIEIEARVWTRRD